ncbi:MAG: VIT domain-containing protein [Polyangiaceae bacterium]
MRIALDARSTTVAWVVRVMMALAVLALGPGCDEPKPVKLAPSSKTLAELRTIRRGVTVVHRGDTEREPYAKERIGEGAEVHIAEGGLAWLRRDGGATLLVRGPGKIIVEGDAIRLAEGRIFVETPPRRAETVLVPEGSLVFSAVRASLDVKGGATEAYVLDGEIRTGDSVAHAGEKLRWSGSNVSVEPAAAWEDWTGGLATTLASTEPAPYGVGTIGARKPGQQGWPFAPLTIQRLDVRVKIDGDLAITEVDQTFFNPFSEVVEGIYRFRTPQGAILERFGVDRGDGILYGYVQEQKKAEAQYTSHVFAGSTEDPALLAWSAPGEYEARLYPIQPGEVRRVVVRYTEWLSRSGEKAERRLYSYPMAFEGDEDSAPQIEDLSIEVDLADAGVKELRTSSDAVRVGDVVVVRDHDVVPRADFSLELYDAGGTDVRAVRSKHVMDLVSLGYDENALDERKWANEADYLLVPVRTSDAPKREDGLDLVLVVDTSAGTDAAMLRLARATTRALLAHLGPKDRVAVFAGDDGLRPLRLASGEATDLRPADEAAKAEILEGLAQVEPGGATDLAAMLTAAAGKLGDSRASAIVYIGDGAATVGETDLASLREHMKKAPRLVRTFGLGIGDSANLGLLAGLSTGGFASRVADERGAARAALSVLETAERAADLGATVDLGPNVERVYPRDLGAVTAGETTLVVGRLVGDAPKTATLTTQRGSTTLTLAVKEMKDNGDLRRRWAMGRLDQLMDEAAGRAALVDLGVRQSVITPVTSIYVPTSREMTRVMKDNLDRRVRARIKLKASEVTEQAQPTEQRPDQQASGEGRGASKPTDLRERAKYDNSGTRAKGEEGAMKPQSLSEGDDGTLDQPSAPSSVPMAAATAAPAASAAAPTGAWGRDADLGDDKDRAPRREDVVSPKAPAPTETHGYATEPTPSPNKVATTKPVTAATTTATSAENLPPPSSMPTTPSKETTAAGGSGALAVRLDNEEPNGIRIDRPAAVIIVTDDPGRIVRLCGPGASLPFMQRKDLWRERLSGANANPSAIYSEYRHALSECEAPTMRERRAFLLLTFDYLPSVSSRVSLYRLLVDDVKAADVVYRGILARITTPAQMREFNGALGLATVDPETLEKTIAEAKDNAERVTKLRALLTRFPDDETLALRLLDALEDAGDVPAARLFAQDLRKRSSADATIRTAVGELFLRIASKATKPEDKESAEHEAKRSFGEIVEFSPDDPVARRRLGDLYRAHGYFAEATRQYETLAKLMPDDPTPAVLLAACSNGLGKLEEAVKWTEKGAEAGAPDVAQGPHATARAFAALFLAWGRMDARAAGHADEVKALNERLEKVLGEPIPAGRVRAVLTWSHPELHPTLWSNAVGAMMPAAEGDITLGLAQAMLQDRGGAEVEVRLESAELAAAARLGATATLTVVFNEGKDAEVVVKREVTFGAGAAATQRFSVQGGKVEVVR